ncbi:MAG TPA: CHAT domain-containing protein, partial [Acidobacteriota bacterium]|nr:CHAT domain-containing protein [Acidobacteriota bacterium]
MAGFVYQSPTQSNTGSAPVDFQTPIERELKGGEKHTYPLKLNANDFLKLVVEQRGIDVVVRLRGQGEKTLQEIDSPNGTQGPEPLSYIVETDGTYTLEIESLEKAAPAGKYELRSEGVRPATEEDRARNEVERLNTQADRLRLAGKYDQALPLAQQALEKSEKIFGMEHLLVATTCRTVAIVLLNKADYPRAEQFALRSLAIREKQLGPINLDVSDSLNTLAVINYVKQDYPQAESLYLRVLSIREKILGIESQESASILSNLGVLYYAKGDYLRAESVYQRALAIYEKLLGPSHPEIAVSLNNLGALYYAQGDFIKAESLLQRALAIKEKVLDPVHPEMANTLNNLAMLYYSKGDFKQAEVYSQQVLTIREKVFGPDHPDVAQILNNLGNLYRSHGDYVQAELLLQRAQAIWEKVFGPDHPDVASSLNNLGLVYQAKGDYTQAELLLKRALAIREKKLGPNHPGIALCLNNLAVLSRIKGDDKQAEALLQRALVIWEQALGPDHQNVLTNLNNLAVLYQAKGDIDQAIGYAVRTNEASERDLLRNLISGSERQKLLYLVQTKKFTDQSISLSLQVAPQNPVARQTALTFLLRRKGRTLDALASAVETLRRQQKPETQKLLNDYTSLVGQLSVLTLRGPGQMKLQEHLAILRLLEEQKEKMEAEISQQSREFQAQFTPITLTEVQKQIPVDAVLVEFVLYPVYNAKTDTYTGPRYAVYTLDQTGKIMAADLGEASLIDQHLANFHKVISTPTANLETEIKPASQILDQLIMKPVRALIGKARHLLISPDSNLSRLPFAALMDEKGKFLVENYRITHLTSGRDLLRLAVKIENHNPPLIMADPDYSTGKGPVLAGKQYVPLIRLVGTKLEGISLKNLFPDANLKMQAEATKQALKGVQRPEILHIATHGRFLEDKPQPQLPQIAQRSLVPVEPQVNVEQLKLENPLLRSWLFFAGANHDGNDQNDGTLTALEAAQLDLWGTKLVVLSACETGVGEAKTGDGVYGLRRALVLA